MLGQNTTSKWSLVNAETLEMDKFVYCSDRFKQVGNDFDLQSLTTDQCCWEAVHCYEQMARFCIMSMHELCECPYWDRDMPQWTHDNTKVLAGKLDELQKLYNRMSERGWVCPNQAEFASYLLLIKAADGAGSTSRGRDCH